MDSPSVASRRDPKSPRRLYAFTVVSLATLLVLLVLWRPPVISYSAESSVFVQLPAGMRPVQPAEILAALQYQSPPPDGVSLSVTEDAQGSPSGIVRIEATSPDAAVARQAANEAAQGYISAISALEPPPGEFDALRSAAQQTTLAAQKSLENAEQALEQFTSAHRDVFGPAEDASPAMRPNPAWQELEDQLKRLEAHRQQLLRTLTDRHPEVLDVESQIAATRQMQAALPREVPADAAEDAAQVAPPELAALRTQHAELQEEVLAAQTAYREAQRIEAEAIAAADAQVRALPKATLAEHAQIASLATAATSPRLLVKALALALAVGLAVAVLIPRRVKRLFLDSVAEVLRTLSLPLVGAISSEPLAPRPREPRWRRQFCRLLVGSAELLVFAALVAVIIGAVALPGWAAELRNDPLSAMQQAVVQFIELPRVR